AISAVERANEVGDVLSMSQTLSATPRMSRTSRLAAKVTKWISASGYVSRRAASAGEATTRVPIPKNFATAILRTARGVWGNARRSFFAPASTVQAAL